MYKYTVTVWTCRCVEVEANSEEEAKKKAIEKSQFDDVDYCDINTIEEI